MSALSKSAWDKSGIVVQSVREGNVALRKEIAKALQAEMDVTEEVLKALEGMINDIGYVFTSDGCECCDFEEDGQCVHTRAASVMAAVRGK